MRQSVFFNSADDAFDPDFAKEGKKAPAWLNKKKEGNTMNIPAFKSLSLMQLCSTISLLKEN